jgi:SPP1 gp7 family putative phage head morphogenesis protein
MVVPKEAVQYFRRKKITPSFSFDTVWGEEHRVAFTIAHEARTDVLTDVKAAMDDAIENGVPFKEFRKQLEPKLRDRGWLPQAPKYTPTRLKLIYDTNLRTAHSAGQWQRIERTKKALPYLVYQLGPSARHRPEHVDLEGTLLPVDDPFWSTHMPPNGFGCKCTVSQLTKYATEERGGVTERPETPPRVWTHKGTGKRVVHPYGTDPGWDHNHGKQRVPPGLQDLHRKLHGRDT